MERLSLLETYHGLNVDLETTQHILDFLRNCIETIPSDYRFKLGTVWYETFIVPMASSITGNGFSLARLDWMIIALAYSQFQPTCFRILFVKREDAISGNEDGIQWCITNTSNKVERYSDITFACIHALPSGVDVDLVAKTIHQEINSNFKTTNTYTVKLEDL